MRIEEIRACGKIKLLCLHFLFAPNMARIIQSGVKRSSTPLIIFICLISPFIITVLLDVILGGLAEKITLKRRKRGAVVAEEE